MRSKVFINCLLFSFALAISTKGQEKLNSDILKTFEFRNLGAYRAGAWISAIAVPENPTEKNKYTYFVSARNGGVWKTINNGTTFYPIFEKYGVNTIGAIAIAPSNSDIVWVGTGDAYNSRSSYAGNGIYKSTDGGETFTNMGLGDSHHISKIIINPTNPDIIYVAVMGHLFTPNEQRGVFKTSDGGKTWKKVLYIDNNTGVIELVISYQNPEVLYAAAYEKDRYPWHFEAGGKNSAIYKTSNGGNSWEKLSNGLPKGVLGRIGLSTYRKNSDIVFALVENLNPKDSTKKLDTQDMMNTARDNYYDQLKGGELYKSVDGGKSWQKTNSEKQNLSSKAAYSFNLIYCNPTNENNLWVLSAGMHISFDGGKSFTGFEGDTTNFLGNMFGDHRTLWVDPLDGNHIRFGSDGGLYETFDGGKTTRHLYHIPIEELYTVSFDYLTPYNVYIGLQDHDVWRGPSNGWSGEIGPEDWTVVGSGDGMYCQVDKETGKWIYSTGQFGQHMLLNAWNGQKSDIMPVAPKGQPKYRYTWTTPLQLSPHNSSIIYTGAQMMLRSINQGKDWEEISPDLTTNDSIKQNGRGHIKYCTITTHAESPIKSGVIWAGTDDGRVHFTLNNGKDWIECTKALANAGCPVDFWTSRVFASNFDLGTAYVTKSGYTKDDFRPFVFKTTDYGKTWKNISNNLPNQPINVIWEDKDNKNLLFVGNDGGLYVSIDGGLEWIQFKQLPSVPVKDIVVHPRENDLIVATYGRGLYITNITSLKQFNNELFVNEACLFEIKSKPLMNFSRAAWLGNRRLMGDSHLFTPNEPNAFEIWYYINRNQPQKGKQKGKPIESKIEIWGPADSLLKTFDVKEVGIGKLNWYFRKQTVGKYTFKLFANGKVYTKTTEIIEPLKWPVGNFDMQK